MTPQNIFPTFRYEDAKAAIAWLRDTVGFEELSIHEGDGGTIEHAELTIAGNVIMLGSARSETEDRFATSRCVTYVTIDDVDAHYERARQGLGVNDALQGGESRAIQGRRERRVLCTRATEDAGVRRLSPFC